MKYKVLKYIQKSLNHEDKISKENLYKEFHRNSKPYLVKILNLVSLEHVSLNDQLYASFKAKIKNEPYKKPSDLVVIDKMKLKKEINKALPKYLFELTMIGIVPFFIVLGIGLIILRNNAYKKVSQHRKEVIGHITNKQFIPEKTYTWCDGEGVCWDETTPPKYNVTLKYKDSYYTLNDKNLFNSTLNESCNLILKESVSELIEDSLWNKLFDADSSIKSRNISNIYCNGIESKPLNWILD